MRPNPTHGGVVEVVGGLGEVRGDRSAQGRDAVMRGVVRGLVLDGGRRRRADVRRGVQVRVARADLDELRA